MSRRSGWVGPAIREDQVERVPKSLLRVVERIQKRKGLRSRYQALEFLAHQLTNTENALDKRRVAAKAGAK